MTLGNFSELNDLEILPRFHKYEGTQHTILNLRTMRIVRVPYVVEEWGRESGIRSSMKELQLE